MEPAAFQQRAITVVIAEDHEVVRQGLSALLHAEPDISVVGEASDGIEAADLVERLKPSVLLLDLLMPGLGGVDVIRRVAKRSPRTKVVVLSMHANEEHVVASLRAGASAYLTKDAGLAELMAGVREACAGRRYLSAPFSSAAIDAYLSGPGTKPPNPYDSLTAREREVLHLAAEGNSNSEIGERLKISPRTVETHRANAMRKLGLRGQTDLVLFAVERSLIPPDRGLAGSRRDQKRPAS